MRKSISCILLLTILLVSCTSRLRTDISLFIYNQQTELENGDCYYFKGFQLDFDAPLKPIQPGPDNIIVFNQTIIDDSVEPISTGFFTAKKNLDYRLYFEIPNISSGDSLNIKDKSFCDIIGNYEIDEKFRRYSCQEGYLTIDSVKANRLFGKFRGTYLNSEDKSLDFGGFYNIKKRKTPLI